MLIMRQRCSLPKRISKQKLTITYDLITNIIEYMSIFIWIITYFSYD